MLIECNYPLSLSGGKKLSFVEQAIQRQHCHSIPHGKIYKDEIFLLLASYIYERLFSKAGFTLGDRRKSAH